MTYLQISEVRGEVFNKQSHHNLSKYVEDLIMTLGLMISKVFPILALSIFSSMLGAGVVAPLLPIYAESLGATGVWIGLIYAVFSISHAISMLLFGRVSDRRGRKAILSLGLFLYSLISLGFLMADSVIKLMLVRLLHGAAGGMVLPIAQAYLGDVCPDGEEGKWMGYANAAFFTGFGFGPLMGGLLTEHFGMSSTFLTMSGLNLLAFLIVLFFLPEVSRKKLVTSTHLSFRKLVASRTVRGLLGFRLAFALGRSAFVVFLPIFAGIYLDLSPALIGVLLATNILLMSISGVPAGSLADKMDRRGLLLIGGLVNIAFLALVPLAQGFWYLMALCILGSLGGAIVMPAGSALMVEEGRRFGMGSTVAVYSVAFSAGMAIGPILSGAIRDVAGINSVFYFGAAVMLVGTGLFAWFTQHD